ncbi:MAG: NAD-dependent epimerase/dehydratase family protein [Myxococcota bacterium]|nr:NAD-dependent epimerase/dehydratase family protein [Myxococcota bacterium]
MTGGTGMVGSHAAAALARAGHRLRLLARTPARVGPILTTLGVRDPEIVPGDITDRAAVAKALEGCDAVLHAAALLTFDRRRVDDMLHSNIEGTRNVLEQAHERALDPIVMVSSTQALWMPGVGELTAALPVATPRDPYGRSKAAAERIARDLQARGAPVVTLYPGAVWGPHNPTLGDQITTIFAMVKSGYFLSVEGGIPIVDVRDVAQAISRAMEPRRGPRRYMLAGHYRSHDELRELISRLRGKRLLKAPVPSGLLRWVGRVCDVLREHFGFDPGAVSGEAMLIATSCLRGDSSHTLAELGLALRPLEETVEAQMLWMYRHDHLSAHHVGALAQPVSSARSAAGSGGAASSAES